MITTPACVCCHRYLGDERVASVWLEVKGIKFNKCVCLPCFKRTKKYWIEYGWSMKYPEEESHEC